MAARTAVVAGTANRVQHKQNERWAAKDQAEYDEQAAAQQQQAPPVAAAPAAPVAPAQPEYMAELEQLSQLKQQGIITEEEFQGKKAQLLGL